MSAWMYRLYGLIFRCMRVMPLKEKAVFFMVHDCKFHGNLRYVHDTMKHTNPEIARVVLSKKRMLTAKGSNAFSRGLSAAMGQLRFWFVTNYHLATARYVFLNDNFLPMAYMNFRDEVKLIQLWHGAGAFKRFGLDTETDPLVRELVSKGNRRIDYIPVTAEHIVPIYESAMGVPVENIFNDGIPLMDYYFSEKLQSAALARLYKTYPELQGKKVVFYCPTFRTDAEDNDAVLSHFDCERLLEELGEEYVICLRFHPQRTPKRPDRWPERCYDLTDYEDIKAIYSAADVMITDYSCTAVEYALLKKPLLFYAYDFEKYDRGCYVDYEALPGGIQRTMPDLIAAVKKPEAGLQNAEYFVRQHFDCELKYGYSQRLLERMIP